MDFRYLINPLTNFEISLTFKFNLLNWSFDIYFKSVAGYNWERNSPEEAFAIYKKRTNSFVVSRSNPSAILEVIEILALLIWPLNFFTLKNSLHNHKCAGHWDY